MDAALTASGMAGYRDEQQPIAVASGGGLDGFLHVGKAVAGGWLRMTVRLTISPLRRLQQCVSSRVMAGMAMVGDLLPDKRIHGE